MQMKPGRPRALNPKDKVVPVRLSESGLRALDKVRGGVSRSAFLRGLLRNHIEKEGQA
jgi:hypothetical protein